MIIDYFDGKRKYCHDKATVQLKSGHIGVDQLTREQYSGVKTLRVGCTLLPPKDSIVSAQ